MSSRSSRLLCRRHNLQPFEQETELSIIRHIRRLERAQTEGDFMLAGAKIEWNVHLLEDPGGTECMLANLTAIK